MAKHFHSLIINDIRNETEDCISVAFDIPEDQFDEFKFNAGQNITLRASVDGETLRRSYSICTSPHENELRIAIKKLPTGKFSTYAHRHLKIGACLDVLAPTGEFSLTLSREHKKHYIAFAAGSGITPVISILKSVLVQEPGSRFTLIYGNKNRSSVIFSEELLSLKNKYPDHFQLVHIFSREKMDAPLFEGRIDTAKCALIFKQIVPLTGDQEFLLCGPAEMIFSIREWLLSQEVSEKKIHYELFADPGESLSTNEKTKTLPVDSITSISRVTIHLDGRSMDFNIPFEGVSILDSAVRAGADLPFACRAGVCATCRAKLLEGKVTMDQNYSLADEELDEGFILACQAHPASEKLTIDFDIR